MPGQPLLKATLLKEAYGQLVELNGTEKKRAVEGVSPSRLNVTERRFFDLIAPEIVPEKAFQKRRPRGLLRKTGLQIKDLLDVYKSLVGARSKNKYTDRITRWRRSVYKGFSTKLHKKVGTTKRESRNFPSDDVDFDRAGEPFSSSAESLKSHGNASLESVEAESEEKSCQVLDWDDNEHPSEIQTPLVCQRMRYRQDEESRSTNGARIKTQHTISGENSSEALDCDRKSSAKSLEGLSEMGQGQSAEEDSRRTGIASRPCNSKSPCMLATTESERNCNPVDGMFDTVMTKAIQPSVENSTGRGAKADFSANRSGSVSLRELLVQAENVEDRRSFSSRQVSDLGLVAPRRRSGTNAHDLTLRTTKGDAEGGDQSLPDLSRNDGEFEQLSDQEVNCRKPHNYGNEKDDHVNDFTEKFTSDRGTVDAKQALRPSEQPEVSESSFAKGNGRSHRRSSSLEIIFNMFGKCRFTSQAKHDFSRGCPEDSHIIENSSATSRSNFHHRPDERFSNGLEDCQSKTESTEILSADFSKDARSDVSEGNHNSSASKAQSDTFSLMERSVVRYGRSKSTNETTAFPAACTRSWSRTGPTVASATIEKVQKMLGRSTSLRTTQVEQEETKSTQHSEKWHDVSRTPFRGAPTHDNSGNHSSLRQLLRDESTFVWSRGSTRTAEHSSQEEGQKFISLDDVNLNDRKKTDSSVDSPLVWTFKRILCCGQCDGRIKIVTDWIDGVDWTCHTKVRKAFEEENRSVYHSDGYSPPQRSSPQKRTSCRSPRSSSTRKKLSPKRKNDHATRHTRRQGKPVRSDESNKRNMPNRFVLRQHRTEPIPSKSYPKGWNADQLTYSGARRAAGSTEESELADMSHSRAHSHTSIEEGRVWDHQDNKASELWRPPIPSYRRQRRRSTGRSTPTSRFQRECVARQSNSTSPTSTPENQCYSSTAAAALLDSSDQEDSESEIVHRQLECVR